MSLTKSLHTVTAATKVAEYLIRRERQFSGTTAANIASEALCILGYDFDPRCPDWGDDDVLVRVLVNCERAVAKESARRRDPAVAGAFMFGPRAA